MSYLVRKELNCGWQVKIVPCEKSTEIASLAQWEQITEKSVPANVPGDWILDYVKAGVFPDPYFGDNYLMFMEYERHHVFYATEFVSDDDCDENHYLRFEGIDTVADIYLNGKKIGHAENMFIEHEFFAEGLRKGKNELIVHLLPVCLEARKYDIGSKAAAFKYNTESLVMRKAAHSFGWDICPRIVGGGIWKSVFLVKKKPRRIKNVHIFTEKDSDLNNLAKLSAVYDVEIGNDDSREYEIVIRGKCGASMFSMREKLWFTHGRKEFFVIAPKLWWIRGYGKPHLYDVVAVLLKNGGPVDEISFRFGIRTIELIRDNVTTKEKPGEFRFVLNGKPIFIKGTNWVPCDAFHSRDAERMPKILDLVWDCGCNALRVWGGGVYESDAFYDLCDEKGIFVWQDIMMACAIYPQDERMKTQLTEEVTAVARRLRNHPSLCLWAGDNECDVAYLKWFGGGKNPEDNRLTREIVPSVLGKEDDTRPYLPSSPYLSSEAVEKKLDAPEQHLWGPRKYFKGKFYRKHTATFASEMGYHGCNSVESIEKFIPKEYLWGYKNNKMWLYHSASPEIKNSPYTYRIRLMAKQIGYFFGEKPLTLENFSKMSQIVQAEAKKYFIESFRCRMGTRTGLIWWNIMDCWPQFSDAVVDWYFDKKLAYYYIRNSQQPLCLMMDKIRGETALFSVSDLDEDKEIEYTVTIGKKIVARGNATAKANASTKLCRIKERGRKFFVIRWKTPEEEGCNHYLSGRPFFAYHWYRDRMEKSGLLAAFVGDKGDKTE